MANNPVLEDAKAAKSKKNVTRTDDFATALAEHVRAGYQILYVPTSEESRVEREIVNVGRDLNIGVATWDMYEGLSHDKYQKPEDKKKYARPNNILELMGDESAFTGNWMFVFRDLDDFMNDPLIRRGLKSLAESNRLNNTKQKRVIIILSPRQQIHEKLKSVISVVDFSLPTEENLTELVDYLKHSIDDKQKAELTDELRTQIAANLLGLTSSEAENCLSRCIVRHGGFDEGMISTIKDEKASIVKKSEVLTYIPESKIVSREEVGGYDSYMDWLDRRKLAYTPAARAENIDYPKGCVLLGPPGTGKSEVAKATCMFLGLPGYILDIGSLFGSLVGESEQRTRDVLKQIDAQKGCVLVIDEADKALANATTSTGDSGVTRRVFGTILTWLAENRGRTFCIMTLNRTTGLPPEFLRAGRFDAIFYTDLPNEKERKQIIDIHFKKRGVDPASLPLTKEDWEQVLQKTEGFVGSELEEMVKESRYLAFAETGTGTPSLVHTVKAVENIIPMSKNAKEELNEIREFCKIKGKPVTTREKKSHRRSRAVDVGNN